MHAQVKVSTFISFVSRLFRYRLLTNQCQNQGFILDGLPESFNQAKLLLRAEDDKFNTEDSGEDGRDPLDKRLCPGNQYLRIVGISHNLQYLPYYL